MIEHEYRVKRGSELEAEIEAARNRDGGAPEWVSNFIRVEHASRIPSENVEAIRAALSAVRKPYAPEDRDYGDEYLCALCGDGYRPGEAHHNDCELAPAEAALEALELAMEPKR